MQINIMDYNLQNIIFVHNFILGLLIFVFLFVFIYLILTLKFFEEQCVWVRMKNKFYYSFIKKKSNK